MSAPATISGTSKRPSGRKRSAAIPRDAHFNVHLVNRPDPRLVAQVLVPDFLNWLQKQAGETAVKGQGALP